MNKREKCQYYKKCGACQLQNLDYKAQLLFKEKLCVRLLGKYAHVENIVAMDKPYNYRNKAQAAFSLDRNKKIISGIYQSSTHRVTPIEYCMIQDKTCDDIIISVRKLVKDFKFKVYDEFSRYGFLRHILIKKAFATGEIMLVFVCNSPIFPAKNNFIKALLKLHPNITTIVMNTNQKGTQMTLGDAEKVLYGKGYISDILCGMKFKISAKSFYQINPIQTEKLYSIAMDYANIKPSETVIDAYCGTGTIGLIASKNAKFVLGIEVNKDAVKDAISNARENKVQNTKFICADAGEIMDEMANSSEKCDVVFMDPPRAGSDEKFLNSVCTLAPSRIVYISCNLETLARDVDFLSKNNYKIKKIQPVDMFPHTNHVECVVLMSRV